MILDEILNILKNDDELTSILKPTATDKKIYMYESTRSDNCIVYNFIPITDDGIKGQARLDVTSISQSYDIAQIMLDRIKHLLITIANNNLTNSILTVEQSGGGSLKDGNTYRLKAFFVVKYRKG